MTKMRRARNCAPPGGEPIISAGRPGRNIRLLLWVGLLAWGLAAFATPWLIESGFAQTAPAESDQDTETTSSDQASEATGSTSASTASGTALVLKITGVIGPAVSLYLREGIADAEGTHDLIVLEMDTPGGLDTSMREMIQAILASRVPVATFVSPSGARAASAGTYILYASHVAAMAPSTTLGAATPIQLGGGGQPGSPPSSPSPTPGGSGDKPSGNPSESRVPALLMEAAEEASSETEEGEAEEAAEQAQTPSGSGGMSAAERKAVNDAAAYIRGLAIKRGRNVAWAEEAVRKGVSLDSSEAVKINVIDLVARDLPDLLTKIDGRVVDVEGVGEVTLKTRGLTIQRQEMSWIQELLAVITNPNIALVLMQLGVLGLIIELYNPGAIFPGVVGVVCLLLGLTALAVLPVSVGGLALLIAGLIFMALELFVASGGILAVAGTVAFGFGAFFLFDTDVPEFRVSITLILITTAIMAFLVFVIVSYALMVQRRGVVTGAEGMVGLSGVVISWSGDRGQVRIDGELWNARCEVPLAEGQEIVAERVDGLTIWVRPKELGSP